ncbi:putative antirestriction adenine methyltransferase [Streptomyces griseofuscus]|uniref:putative antirestriction adenine methyltransferase n=1 Tax=Streptomyces griseofuscus TaxID=146922 RepID=UPI0033D08C78
MPAGFAAPGVLFAGNSSAPDRAFYRQVFNRLPRDQYTRYVEVGVGSFAAALVAANAGIPPSCMETSDVTLYTGIVGTCVSGGDLTSLGMTLDGEPVELPDAPIVEQAAHLLYVHWLARMQAKPEVDYWTNLVTDMIEREDEHKARLVGSLQQIADRLPGVKFTPKCMWDHIAEAEDDPHAIIIAAPPTYKAGFEKFFDTGGRVEWNEPPYSVFDPDIDMQRLADHMRDKAALLMFLQEERSGIAAHETPVFAHPLGDVARAFVISNRPEEIFKLTGGPKVALGMSRSTAPTSLPIIPPDHQVTDQSRVEVVPAKGTEVDYYRDLWMHRLAAAPGSYNMLVIVDGFVAGVIGYGAETMTRPYPGATKYTTHLLMRFAFGAPHYELRLTRLATMLALRRDSAKLVFTGASEILLAASNGLVTVEYTRHPEAKGLRGLMQLESRAKHPDGYKLSYRADWSTTDIPTTLTAFITKEQAWRASRSKAKKK